MTPNRVVIYLSPEDRDLAGKFLSTLQIAIILMLPLDGIALLEIVKIVFE